ncbi:MAG TPA: TIR domain-containing protein [Geobacterales bacterium]|nr:TIR domain-containing protein [Geobacterales bacterium]
MSGTSQAVFMSYASQDADAAGRICEALRLAGIEVWFDRSELRGGDAWDAAIRKQVKECALFVPLISAHTDARSEGYFRREWNLAVNRMLDMADDQPFLLPVVIDDTSETMARVPDRFRERQWTRLPGGIPLTEFAERVTRLLAGARAAGVTTPLSGKAIVSDDPGRADEGFWVAVLPFKYSGSNADLTALAEGLSEEIVTGLSRFSYLRVIARGSTLRYAGQAADLRTVGKELGARYVMEGSLRQAGPRLRFAVQLVDAASGAHLWAENYERTFSPETVFELQDELVPRIVSTVADMHGVLPRSMSEAVRSRNPGELSPYEAVLRSFGYFERITGEDLAAARSGLESAVRKAPASGDAWAMLALLCVQDYAQGFNLQADALEKGLAAARRAVEVAPSNHLSHYGLAQALFFLKEFQSFRNAAERAVTLNPMDGNALAFLGELLSYSGDCERGAALAARAKQLNPNHPGFYWFADFYNAYRQQDYGGALAAALNLNLPGHMGAHMVLAATYGQLGERGAAEKAVQDLLKLRPDFASIARGLLGQWWTSEYVEKLIDGWRKAGLEIAPANAAVTRP